jgi:iron(II)-dependent oxidoreductase
VVAVSWYEALAFTRWLTNYYHKKGLLKPECQVTLPSEAEWEKAARGGLKFPKPPIIHSIQELEVPKNIKMIQNSTPQRLYPWGDEINPNLGNYAETKIANTSAVGCFSSGQSLYGAEEMSGNIWEWTRSLWGKEALRPDFGFPYNVTDGRENPDAPDNMARVFRGGAFNYDLRYVRCSFRFRHYPDLMDDGLGFRVVLSLFTADR